MGLKMNLAMALPDGRIVVRRFSDNDTTVIRGDNIDIDCGHCGETVFHREGRAHEGTVSHNRIIGIYRFESRETVGTNGTPGL